MKVVALCALIVALAVPPGVVGQSPDSDAAGTWEGTLGGALRLVLRITRAADGLLLGSMQTLDQGGGQMPLTRIEVKDSRVVFAIGSVGGSFEGQLAGTTLTGTWSQAGRSTPLTLRRTSEAAPAASATPGPAVNTNVAPVTLSVIAQPAPFPVDGRTVLVYEVVITNPSAADVLVTRVEVLDGTRVLASYEGEALNGMIFRPVGTGADNRSVPPMTGVIALLWISLEQGATPAASLTHRVTAGGRAVEGAAVTIRQGGLPTIGPPLAGEYWRAVNGPSNTSVHRRAGAFVEGGPHIAQRFAIDWVKIDENGRTFSGDRLDNRSYYAYGGEAFAVADALVIGVRDGIPENIPGPTSRAVPITNATIAGNFVRLQLADGSTAMYAHFQPGSLRVKEGDRVKRGQVLGLVGNTGNSTEPHLHFHMGDGHANWLAAEGIPYLIDAFDRAPQYGEWIPRTNELPMDNAVVRFRSATP